MKELLTSKAKPILLFLILTVMIEVLGFNWRSLEYRGLTPVSQSDYDITVNEEENYIELTNINQELTNIYLDLSVTKNGTGVQMYAVRLEAIDEGSAVSYKLPKRWIKEYRENSKYLKLNLNGKVSSLKINLAEVKKAKDTDELTLSAENIILNTQRPVSISPLRMLMILACFMLIYCLRPGSVIFTMTYDLKDIRQMLICLGMFLAVLAGIIFVGMRDPYAYNPTRIQNFQYEKLAVSLTKGQFHLDDEPSEALLAMDNPYDRNLRRAEGVAAQWDHAYYEGQYYVYFGITPVLLFYLPYYLMTGSGFPTFSAMLISEMFLLIAVFLLLNTLVKKFYDKISFGHFLILNVLTLVGCGLPYLVRYQTLYALPITMGLLFTVFGLYFWLSAEKADQLNWKRVFFGCACMALVAGCRPQMLLGSFLALPILGPALIREWKARKGKAVISLGVVLLPYIIFGVFLMYYNYSRFGSVFDFGANYNLTTNDMTKRGFRLDRIPLGIYAFLFQPPSFTTTFPFLQSAPFETAYQGVTIREATFGGIFMICPFLWMSPFIFKVKNWLQEKRYFWTSVLCLAFAVIIAVADANMAGILPRYTADFGIFLCLPAVITALLILKKIENETVKKIYHYTLWGLTAVTALLGGMICFL